MCIYRGPQSAIVRRAGARTERANDLNNQWVGRTIRVQTDWRQKIALIVAGLLVILFISEFGIVKGVAVGFMIQASLMLAADLVAEERGKEYQQFLAGTDAGSSKI